MDVITVVAVVLRDEAGRIVTVHKRGTSRFMLPGGKPDDGEFPERTAIREVREELGLTLERTGLELLGSFRSEAANEEDTLLLSTVYTHPWVGEPHAGAEIDEVRMLDPAAPLPAGLTPLLEHRVLPLLSSPLRSLTVFTGASPGTGRRLLSSVDELATALAERGLRIVYGGGHVGLMGALADAALATGGEVTGVIPQHLADRELAHTGLSSLRVVPDMHERKMVMSQLGDAFVALPGGIGTLEELFEAWTWQQLGIHRKPVALYDVDGFFRPLLAMLDEMVATGFVSPAFREGLIVATTPDELLAALRAWVPPDERR